MGRIDHRADIIQILCHLVIILSYNGRIQLTVNDDAVHIRRYGYSQLMQRLRRIRRKFGNRPFLVTACCLRAEIYL